MKKRILAALVLLAMIIGLCGTIASATGSTTETAGYKAGYAKVDINPYYTQAAKDYLLNYLDAAQLKLAEDEWKSELGVDELTFGETIMPVSLQGNSHTQFRISIGKQDDNGDGIVNADDGIFATCIAVTDPNNETVFLMSTDLINGSSTVTSQVRKLIYDKYHITGDRVMINGSHTHHGPGFSAESGVATVDKDLKGIPFSGKEALRQAAYYMHQYWATVDLPKKLFKAAEDALADQSAATLSKGSIDAEQAQCATDKANIEIGDTLNDIRTASGSDDLVTVLHATKPENVTAEIKTNNNGEQYWVDDQDLKHVVVPELADGLYYNRVRHDQSTTVEAMRTTVWKNSGNYYACEYPKVGKNGYEKLSDEYSEYYYIPSNWIINEDGSFGGIKSNDKIKDEGIYNIPKTYVTGNNFNGGNDAVDGVGGFTLPTKYILKEEDDSNFVDAGEDPLPRAYIDKYTVAKEYVEVVEGVQPKLKEAVTIGETTYPVGTLVWRFIDATVASEDHAVTVVDDTMLILKFSRAAAGKDDILLINWRSHTNKNRKSSVDWKKEYTYVGFYDSFYQISSDWINAFRYTLEREGYLVAYFNGAAGNVNGSTPFDSWHEKSFVEVEKDGKTTTVEQTATYVTQADVTAGTYGADDLGKCKESMNGEPVYEGYVIEDASHLRNRGPIHGTELAEVALELLSGTNENYMMKDIVPDGEDEGLRSLQSIYQSDRKTSSTAEFLAAGKHHAWDVEDGNDDESVTLTFPVHWWTDKDGKEIVDKTGGCSMLNVDGTLAQKCVKGVPQWEDKEKTIPVYYTEKEVKKLYNVEFVDIDGKSTIVDEEDDKVDLTETSYTIASYLHANDALATYRLASVGPKVELNAIMLCDEIAIITGTGELFDRYSDTATWSENGISGAEDNKWKTLWDDETYDEPFFLGYCNNGNGYMPSAVTYDYSTGVSGKAQGSYETQTSNYAKSTGEKVLNEFAWMLTNIDIVDSATADLSTKEFDCKACGGLQYFLPLSKVITAHTTGETHHDIPLDGHYYVDTSTAMPYSFTARYACLELNGEQLKGPDRALYVGTGGVTNVQDSSDGETGAVVGQGFEGGNEDGGTVLVVGGATLNHYSGTLKLAVEEEGRSLPGNGGVLHLSGTYNMYGGTIEGGSCSNAGGTIYTGDASALNLYGGSIASGTAGVAGTECSRIRGTVTLAGDASVGNLLIWPEGDVAGYYSKLTVQGEYTGLANITFRGVGATALTEGMTIGLCAEDEDKNAANLDKAYLTVTNTDLIPTVSGDKLVLGQPSGNECKGCGGQKLWLPLSEYLAVNNSLAAGHYCVDVNNCEMAEQTVGNSATVCMDLNGKTLLGSERAFEIASGGKLNIQDSDEGGTLAGQGFTGDAGAGGTVNVTSGGTLNLHSGTLTLDLQNANMPGNGGVVYVDGTFNMYDGTVTGGTSGSAGGNIYISRNEGAYFNMYGGVVETCNSARYGKSTVARGHIMLTDTAIIRELCLWPGTAVPREELLTIQGTYTGEANLWYYTGTPAAGDDIGTSDDAVLSYGNITVSGSELVPEVRDLDETDEKVDIVLVAAKAADLVNIADSTLVQGYTDAQDAVNACGANQKVVLLADATALEVQEDNVTLDLNGKDITTVTVADGKTLSCSDFATADYDITDEIYGKITTIAGGTVKGAEATETTDVYLMHEDDNEGTSFHAVGLTLTDINLRISKVGIYYTSNFAGDSVVQDMVESYGVALSIVGEPTEEAMGDTTHYTRIPNDEAHKFGTANASSNSSILTNIMKDTQGNITNRRNAATPIYGRAYVELKDDGGYLFGFTQSLSLQQVVETVDSELWDDLAANKQQGIIGMYNRFPKVMNKWTIPNIKAAATAAQ